MRSIRQNACHAATVCVLAVALASPAARGQEFPGAFLPPYNTKQQPDEPALRCWFHNPGDNSVAADAVIAKGFKLKGHWANQDLSPTANLFYTWQGPDEMRAACEQAVANRGKPVEALVHWTAATSTLSYNHQIWHEGDLAPDRPVERMVSFGDSLSDKGNFFNDSSWQFPDRWGWFNGRFSNGRVWTEHFADISGLTLYNWAIGGAETKRAHAIIKGLDEQVASFGKYAAAAYRYDISRTLFTVLIGANDFMTDGRTDIKSVTDLMQRQKTALLRLGKMGAKRILVFNLPDISATPSFRMKPDIDRLLIYDKVRLYNEWLPDLVATVAAETGADIRLFDMAGAFRELLDEPQRFGITNTTQSCLNLLDDAKGNYIRKQSPRPECRPDRYVFWDNVHPTTRVHRLIAERAFATADEAWNLGKSPSLNR